MLKTDQQEVVTDQAESLHSLYDRHAGMLLGYIFEVVKDRKLAEEYLVQLFCDLSSHFNEMNWDGTNSWRQLHHFAKDKLAVFTRTVKNCESAAKAEMIIYASQNGYLNRLTDEQKQVFCAIYYHRKTIAEISEELNKTDDLIRKTLKEAFAIIRKGGEN